MQVTCCSDLDSILTGVIATAGGNSSIFDKDFFDCHIGSTA